MGCALAACRASPGSLAGLRLNASHSDRNSPLDSPVGFRSCAQETRQLTSGLRRFIVCCYFVQKSLPLLENQIRESHLRATEELRQCGDHLPNTDADKMFFLVEVRTDLGGSTGHSGTESGTEPLPAVATPFQVAQRTSSWPLRLPAWVLREPCPPPGRGGVGG